MTELAPVYINKKQDSIQAQFIPELHAFKRWDLQGLVKNQISGRATEERFQFWLEGSEPENRKNSRPGRTEGNKGVTKGDIFGGLLLGNGRLL